jgi:hypothetical protein
MNTYFFIAPNDGTSTNKDRHKVSSIFEILVSLDKLAGTSLETCTNIFASLTHEQPGNTEQTHTSKRY